MISRLLVCLTILLVAAKPIDPNQLNQEGVRANSAGDYQRAVDLFRQALTLEPDQAVLRYNLFNALNNLSIQSAGQDQVEVAIQACTEALELVPEDVRVASNLAIFFQNNAVDLLKKKRFPEARESVQDAQKVVEQFKLNSLAATVRQTHARIYLIEGREKFSQNEVAEALDLYDQCIQINPDEALAYLDRSRIYYDQDFFQDAVSDLEMAAEILGENSQLEALLKRLKLEAEQKGQPLANKDTFFVIESTGGTATQEQALKRALRDIRLKVARNLTMNTKTALIVSARWGDLPVTLEEWLSSPSNHLDRERFTLGLSGVDLSGEGFLKYLEFLYVGSLILNVGGPSLPYWFVSGTAQYLAGGAVRLSAAETEQLLTAGENFLLFRLEDISQDKMSRLDDNKQVLLAHLQSKALVAQLVEMVRMNGLRQLLKTLAGGIPFEQALKDAANIAVSDIEKEWKATIGLPSE
jgi:tetratricopeptide (TPR) repeat protein